MYYAFLVLILLILLITLLTLCIIIKYMDKRDNGDLHLKIKFFSFEFLLIPPQKKL